MVLEDLQDGERLAALGAAERLGLFRLLRPRRRTGAARGEFGKLVGRLPHEVGRRQVSDSLSGRLGGVGCGGSVGIAACVVVVIADGVVVLVLLSEAVELVGQVGLLAGDLLTGFALGVEVGSVHVDLFEKNFQTISSPTLQLGTGSV